MELAEAPRAEIDAGDPEAALAILAGAENSLPLHAGHIYSWRAALLTELGRTDAALDALDAALVAGCRFKGEWLRDNPRLAPLRGIARFDDIVDRAASRLARMQADARPALETFIPTTPRPARGFPTLIALHGNNSNAPETEPYWKSAVRLGWVVALPQSGEIGASPDSFTWNDRDGWAAGARARPHATLQGARRAVGRRISAAPPRFRGLVESGNAAGVRLDETLRRALTFIGSPSQAATR